MRSITLFSIALLTAFTLQSCGSGSSGEEAAENQVDSVALPRILENGTTMLDLSGYFLPFSLYVPDSTRGYPEVIETGYGETIVKVGSTYNMIIAEGGDVAFKKVEIMDDLMYTNTIIEEGPEFILYKSEIKESFLEPEFHFYSVKTINGVTFEFRDNKDEGPFAESIARLMMESVNHLQPNQNAA